MNLSTFIKSVILTASIILIIAFWPEIKNACFKTEVVKDKIEIEDVWYHQPGSYSVGHYNDDEYLTTSTDRCEYEVETKVLRDLPQGEVMYYEYRLTINDFRGCIGDPGDFKTIHMTKDYKLKGGGWDHGKFGRGQTSRLQ